MRITRKGILFKLLVGYKKENYKNVFFLNQRKKIPWKVCKMSNLRTMIETDGSFDSIAVTIDRKQDKRYGKKVSQALNQLGFPARIQRKKVCSLSFKLPHNKLLLCICGRYVFEMEDDTIQVHLYRQLSERKQEIIDAISEEMAQVKTVEDLAKVKQTHENLFRQKLRFSKPRGKHFLFKDDTRAIIIPSRVISQVDVVSIALHELLHLGREEECNNKDCLGSHSSTVNVRLCGECAKLLQAIKESCFSNGAPVLRSAGQFLEHNGITLNKEAKAVLRKKILL